MSREFFDTNVLIYRYVADQSRKYAIAERLTNDALLKGTFQISTQVMIEFRNVATRKFATTLSHEAVHAILTLWEQTDVVITNAGLVLEASERCRKHQLGWWDSLIVTAAVRGGASVLYSEDFQHGRVIDGVRIENPFASAVHEERAIYRV